MPNAVVSTHAQMVFAADAIQSQLCYRPDDVVYSPLPLSFDYGMYQLFVAALGSAHVHLADAADAGILLLRRLRESGATVLPGVPSLAAILARLIERHGGTIPLRLLTNTGADLPGRILDQLRRQLPGLQVQLMFGLTECKRVSIMPPDHDRDRPGSCGKSLPGTEVVVVDDDGHPVPPRTVGEIVVRGPHVMAGYWRRPELTAKRFRRVAGLFPQLHTGDYGWLDEDGFLYFSGRRDDIYKSHGFRVSAIEVEAAAIRIPGVRAAAVLAPNAQRPEPVLFAVTDLTRSELHQLLMEQIEHYKVPRHCRVLDALPLNPNGKVDKTALAELGWRAASTELPRELDVAVPKKLSA
jgi:acyl-CoA synthetase (AMP-forming)/AMP-acid ligase II